MQVTFLTTPFAATAVPIRPGDLIVITIPRNVDQDTIQRGIEAFKKALNVEYGPEYRFQILLGFEGLDIRSMNEDQMRDLGWQRIPPS